MSHVWPPQLKAKTLQLFSSLYFFISFFQIHFLFSNKLIITTTILNKPFHFISFHFIITFIFIFPKSSMGLNNQITDLSSDSLPIFLLAVIANTVSYLRSLIFTFLNTLNIISHHQSNDLTFFSDSLSSGLAGIILLADQLNLNRVFSYKFSPTTTTNDVSDCVVCLNSFIDGEQVRKLTCHHVFHKDCFDGWIGCMNFKCPLCRSSLVSDEQVVFTRRRVADDVMDWFGHLR